MPRFFVDALQGDQAVLTGEDARHIGRSLRMAVGEELTLCDGRGSDYRCRIIQMTAQEVYLQVQGSEPSRGEPSVRVRLYQAMPKGDKMEFILQKAVELGVGEVIPVLTQRCVARPDTASMEKKAVRYRRILLEAAKQCGRGVIPRLGGLCSFQQALLQMRQDPCSLLFYEASATPLRQCIPAGVQRLSILIGSEGGLEPSEVQQAREQGVAVASLGSRILRCETAGMAALAAIMYETGNL